MELLSRFKIALLCFFAVCMFSCESEPDNGYLIEGTVTNWAGQHVELVQTYWPNMQSRQGMLVDTTTADAEGYFRFSGDANKEALVSIRVGNTEVPMILTAAKFKIEGDLEQGLDIQSKPAQSVGASTLYEFSAETRQNELKLVGWGRHYQMLLGSGTQEEIDSVGTIKDEAALSHWQRLKNCADTTSHPLMAFYCVESLSWALDFDFIRNFSNRMVVNYADSRYTQDLQSKIGKWELMLEKQAAENMVGREAPEIALLDQNGEEHRLSNLRGQVVLVDFWASWCAPCRRENPNVVATYKKYKDQGFTVFSVSLDRDAGKWEEAIVEDDLLWDDHVIDLIQHGSPAAQEYKVTGIPAGFLVDRDGKIVAQREELRGPGLEQWLLETL